MPSVSGTSGESPADISLRTRHAIPELSSMFLSRGISPTIGELRIFFINENLALLKKSSGKRTQKKSPANALQQQGWQNETLHSETNAHMIHQPVTSWTER